MKNIIIKLSFQFITINMKLYFIIIMIIERLLHGDKMQMIIQCCNERDQCQIDTNRHSFILFNSFFNFFFNLTTL